MLTVVTGAAGFIGSRLVQALNRRGITDILAVDDLEDGAKAANLAQLEIQDYVDKREFLTRLGTGSFDGTVETVFHLGANSNTRDHNGRAMMENNYAYSKVLLDWCQDEEVPLIYASSASVYGNGRASAEQRANEQPLNVYAYSKFLFDQYARGRLMEAASQHSSQIAGLRYFNVYGPGEAHKKKTGMNSIAMQAFEQYRATGSVRLFAGSGGYADGEQLRDFVHVDDAVAVNLWLLEKREVCGIFNCGTGRAQSFNQVAAAVINTVNGSDLPIEVLVQKGMIQYVPFPAELAGRYQSYTQADLGLLRAAGCTVKFRPVEQGVAEYARELMKT